MTSDSEDEMELNGACLLLRNCLEALRQWDALMFSLPAQPLPDVAVRLSLLRSWRRQSPAMPVLKTH